MVNWLYVMGCLSLLGNDLRKLWDLQRRFPDFANQGRPTLGILDRRYRRYDT